MADDLKEPQRNRNLAVESATLPTAAQPGFFGIVNAAFVVMFNVGQPHRCS